MSRMSLVKDGRQLERWLLVRHQDRSRVAADQHERAVTERDLAGEPGQHVQSEQRDEVDAHVGELLREVDGRDSEVEAFMKYNLDIPKLAGSRLSLPRGPIFSMLFFLILSLIVLTVPRTVEAESRGKSLKRAEAEIRKGNFTEAEKVYRRLVEHDPEDKAARLGLSFVLMKRAQLAGAYEEAARVVAADPLNSRGHALMGSTLLRSGEFRQSVEAFYTSLKFNNKEPLGWAGLAEVAYFENDTRNAYEGFRRAILLDPMEPDNYVSLARTCSRLEYYLEAANSYERFLEVAPKTDAERRARIRGLIDFYRYLGSTKIHRMGGQAISTIPFELVQNRPFLKVMINGKGPLRFVIDTGASLSVISDRAAQTLGIKPVAKGGMARAVGGSGSFPIVYGLLDSFEIGPVKIDTVPIYIRTVHAAPDTPESERADGYIGLSVLSNYSVTINYQTRTLMLDRTPAERETASDALRCPDHRELRQWLRQ